MTYEFKQVDFQTYAQMRDEIMTYYINKRVEYTFHRGAKRWEIHEGWTSHYLIIISRDYNFDNLASDKFGSQSVRIVAPYGTSIHEVEYDLCRYQPAIYQMLTGIILK